MFRPLPTTAANTYRTVIRLQASTALTLRRHKASYRDVYAQSIDPAQREAFWKDAASGIDWIKPPQKILEQTNEGTPEQRWNWFRGGQLNTSYNCLDRHLRAGRGDQTAIIYHSAMLDKREHITYEDLTERVAKLAGALVNMGVEKGDVVVIYMPMIPEALISMLACARIGAIHNVVFGGFAPKQLAARIDDSKPKVVLSASCGFEPGRIVEYKPLLDEAVALSSHKPNYCVIYQRPKAKAQLHHDRDVDWEVVNRSNPQEPVPLLAEDPLYVIYTSGTTGQPKAIQRENGGHAVALNWSMPHIYGVDTGDIWWAASDVGWVVGSSYIVYGPLLRGCTSVLFEGKPVGTPDAGEFWRTISEHKVKSMFCAPTAIRAIKAADPNGTFLQDLDMSHFQGLFLAGERCDPNTVTWATDLLDVPVIDHWWQTETGFPISSNFLGFEEGLFPIKPGSSTFPVPGWDVQVLNESSGMQLGPNELGQLAVKLPLPPCAFTTLFNDEERFQNSYLSAFPGYYNTGDAGHIDEEGYISVMTRTDDIINVAGHRLSTGQMEEVLARHPAVAECAVIGIQDELKGEIPLGLVVLKQSYKETDTTLVEKELVGMIRDHIGPVAAFKNAICVKVLPKVKSGKILRKTMKKIFEQKEYSFPGNIEDASVLTYIEEVAGEFRKIH